MRLKSEWTPGTKDFYSNFIVPPILNGDLPRPLLERIAEVAKESPEKKDAALSAFNNTLRNLVDQWIDSGKGVQGEEAWRRSINWQPPTDQKPLSEILLGYRRRHPPLVTSGEDDRFEIWMLPSRLNSMEPTLRAHDMAIYVLLHLLDSPTRERLSRCDKCRQYFTRERAPRKNAPIYHGTYCSHCQGKGGARRTISTRTKRLREMVCWAADFWPKWARRHGHRSEWIADKVNRQMQRKYSWVPITKNWVTRHEREIEAEVKRRNDAKRED